jgi:hypothetical protein
LVDALGLFSSDRLQSWKDMLAQAKSGNKKCACAALANAIAADKARVFGFLSRQGNQSPEEKRDYTVAGEQLENAKSAMEKSEPYIDASAAMTKGLGTIHKNLEAAGNAATVGGLIFNAVDVVNGIHMNRTGTSMSMDDKAKSGAKDMALTGLAKAGDTILASAGKKAISGSLAIGGLLIAGTADTISLMLSASDADLDRLYGDERSIVQREEINMLRTLIKLTDQACGQ